MLVFLFGRRCGLGLAVAAALLLGAGGWFGVRAVAAEAAQAAVAIEGFSFGPAILKVARGTRVVWKNTDDEPHTVTSADDPRRFKSSALDTGDSFAVTFDKPGAYKYFCTVHPYMQGTVVVE